MGTERGTHRDRLNPKYTFDQFVIGAGNRFAHAAALAVAELPGHSYNPLFLHGSPGIGKTHLLHAIGNYVERYGSGLRVRYATIEEFTSEFVEAVRVKSTADFKQRFRGADVVLIDDVQFLTGRARTREEFFHTFNALVDAGRQLVMTSDCAPEDIPGLEDRLTERFRSGLVVELDTPELEVRRAILAKRARLDDLEVDAAVIAEIADRVTTSVRALEGALIRVVAYASLKDEPATPALVRHVLRRLGEDSVDGCLRHRRDPRRRRTGVRGRTRGAPGARPAADRGGRPPGRDVPRPRAHRAQPSGDRPRHRGAQSHHRAARREPRQRRHAQRRLDAQRGAQPAPPTRSSLVLTGVNGRINSFRTWAIALPKPHRPGYPLLNSPQSPLSEIGSIF